MPWIVVPLYADTLPDFIAIIGQSEAANGNGPWENKHDGVTRPPLRVSSAPD